MLLRQLLNSMTDDIIMKRRNRLMATNIGRVGAAIYGAADLNSSTGNVLANSSTVRQMRWKMLDTK